MLGRLGLFLLAPLALASCSSESSEIRVTGSSTIFPFSKAVGEAFVQAKSGHKAPVFDTVGTGVGILRFCEKDRAIDIVDASRRMRRAEFNKCQAAGIRDITEIAIGLDGIALAESNNGPKIALTRKDIYLALAANPLGKPNTAKTWKEVNPALPAIPIQVLGPPATSGTRDVFVELILQPGCLEAMPDAKALQAAGDPAQFEKVCRQIRADGPYVTKGEDDSVIVSGLEQDSNALGVFGYSYLEQNAGRLNGVPIDGVEPEYATIASGKYPGMRTLYLYVKTSRLKGRPAVQAYLDQYAAMWSPGGPLVKRGLIALPDKIRARSLQAIQRAEPIDPATLH
ncbi:substrate-binding domain-containing protein [Sphingomonas sp. PB4P5]|uniref:substrate-binding domain-containing protein n=1 Tax=Parasphingomonas puruogangriensis TaxID=3096155 RepID=UPI002FC758F2